MSSPQKKLDAVTAAFDYSVLDNDVSDTYEGGEHVYVDEPISPREELPSAVADVLLDNILELIDRRNNLLRKADELRMKTAALDNRRAELEEPASTLIGHLRTHG